LHRTAFPPENGGSHNDSVLSISPNFRSFASIIAFVNARFGAVPSVDGQPGFMVLDPFRGGISWVDRLIVFPTPRIEHDLDLRMLGGVGQFSTLPIGSFK
jgi:hypothetical protein